MPVLKSVAHDENGNLPYYFKTLKFAFYRHPFNRDNKAHSKQPSGF